MLFIVVLCLSLLEKLPRWDLSGCAEHFGIDLSFNGRCEPLLRCLLVLLLRWHPLSLMMRGGITLKFRIIKVSCIGSPESILLRRGLEGLVLNGDLLLAQEIR